MLALPSLPYDEWIPTRIGLHLRLQIIGKIRLLLMPRRNHWWHVPLYLSSRGITTRPMPVGDGRLVEIEADFCTHNVCVQSTDGASRNIPLADGQSISTFYRRLVDASATLVSPLRSRRCHSTRPVRSHLRKTPSTMRMMHPMSSGFGRCSRRFSPSSRRFKGGTWGKTRRCTSSGTALISRTRGSPEQKLRRCQTPIRCRVRRTLMRLSALASGPAMTRPQRPGFTPTLTRSRCESLVRCLARMLCGGMKVRRGRLLFTRTMHFARQTSRQPTCWHSCSQATMRELK